MIKIKNTDILQQFENRFFLVVKQVEVKIDINFSK